MTLFLVTYREVLEEMPAEESSGHELEPTDAEPLQPGLFTIMHNGLTLPVTVGKDDSVIVHINRAEGNLPAGTIGPLFDLLPYWTLAHGRQEGIDELKLSPRVGTALLISSRNKEGYVAVERHERQSDIFKIY